MLVRSNINITGQNLGNEVAFKNCDSFTNSITKIDGTTKMMLKTQIWLCRCIEYSSDYFDTTGRLWFYSEGETVNFSVVVNNAFKSFKYKAKLLRGTETDGANIILKKQNNHCDIKLSK